MMDINAIVFRWVLLIPILILALPYVGIAEEDGRPYYGKKILWVDSYHPSYEWSAGVETGIRQALKNSGAELRIVRMDSKRRSSEGQIRGAALRAKAEIEAFRPDVVIASDDNASKYLVVPYLKNTELPVVFCGVNWDAEPYGFPASNVTGMVEVDLVEAQIEHLSRHARGRRIGFLGYGVMSEQKILHYLNLLFFSGEMKSYLVPNLSEFKAAFLRAQDEVDMLYLSNYAGMPDWDSEVVQAFLVTHARIPTGSHNPFMAPFVLVTLAKDPAEQGEWAAGTALEILAGRSPADIPLARNERGQLIVNLRMAQALNVTFPVETLKAATVIGQEAFEGKENQKKILPDDNEEP